MTDEGLAGDRRERAVYSVLLGRYEQLNQQPIVASAVEPSVRRVLLTDDPELQSDFWEIVVVEPALAADPVRSQRLLKILGHPVLDAFESTLYVDNAVTLRTPPGALLDAWLGDHAMAAPLHSYRRSVLDEFDEVLRLQYDEPARVYEQLLDYDAHHRDSLGRQPIWTAMLARRRDATVAAAMRVWADHVLRYSRRDQLSVLCATEGLDLRTISLDNMESEHHVWPTDLGRAIAQGKSLEPAAGPFLAELRRRDRALADARDAAESAERGAAAARERTDGLEAALAASATDASRLRDVIELLEARVDDERARRAHAADEAFSARVAAREVRRTFEQSTSWRATALLRALRRSPRRDR